MKLISYFLVIILITGCSSIKITPPQPIEFEKTPEYSIQKELQDIPKPDQLVPSYIRLVNNRIEIVTNSSLATHIMLAPNEYAKVGGVVKLAKTYKDVILQQEILINLYITQVNTLKQLLSMERQKAINYFELWSTYQKLYESEKFDHKVDNIINRGIIGVIGASLILLIAL